MRKFVQKGLINILNMVVDGISGIHKYAVQVAGTFIEESQNVTTYIENMLRETLLSSQSVTYYIHALGEVRAQLDGLAKEVEGNKPIGKNDKNVRSILRKVKAIRERLLDEPEVKLEIVFMPYNASMWDSLESVWKAADDSERWNATVVPIPYYVKLYGGQVSPLKYEGDLLPGAVDFVHYDAYDLAEHRPDVIVVHNPYDDQNDVTSLLPQFFSSELKKHTDLLVYIPYFFSGKTVDENFYINPVLANFDKIIVQSENIRSLYLQYWPSEKIVALGSPKVDKALERFSSPPEVPDDWQEIKRATRVVLYNTTLVEMLAYRDTFLEKLQYIFHSFKQCAGVSLLWRPHPLTKECLAAMAPELLERYEVLEQTFIDQAIGILDESADVHRAMAFADAYYGGAGSLMRLFAFSGKPIVYRDMKILSSLPEEKLMIGGCAADEEGILWASSDRFNGLFKLNPSSGEILYMGHIPGEGPYINNLYGAAKWIGDVLVLLPHTAKEIAVFYRKTNAFCKIPLSPDYLNIHEGIRPPSAFGSVIRYGDGFFFFPMSYHAIVEWNPTSGALTYYDQVFKENFELIADAEDLIFRKTAVVIDNFAFLASVQSNQVMQFNMDDGSYILHQVGQPGYRYAEILTQDNAVFWLCPRMDGPIVRWNRMTGEICEYDAYPDHYHVDHGAAPFESLIDNGDSLIAMPLNANMAIQLDKKSGSMRENKLFSAVNPEHSPVPWRFCFSSEGFLYAFTNKERELWTVDLSTEKVVKQKFPVPSQALYPFSIDGVIQVNKSIIPLLPEKKCKYNVAEFFEAVLGAGTTIIPGEKDLAASYAVNSDGTSGRRILQYLEEVLSKEES